ncbi:MAG: flagellar biosynthesis anti-sigma factor FlgM [Halieaceae bacterium]|nr:flagellar biosynthesis anti-sigma factor FlgM [Halieaceae bacterium]|tara:strand:- start:427 stop:729 length:303 start_codon:yes stop_codon:yes gene_type:complete
MPSITETMRSVVPESTGKKDLRAEKTSAPAPDAKAPDASTSESQVDQVELSESVVRSIEDAKFDAAKVEALRLAIMEGNYPLDAKRIAENMLDLERMINS